MSNKPKPWRTYEEVAQYLLNEFAAHFDLGCVEGKQIVPGASGTEWEIDAKGVADNGEAFIIVECRRYTTSRLSQGKVRELAYGIIDTGASGGILVTPLDLQSGAKKVAAHANIKHAILNQDCSTTQYVMQFLNNIFIGNIYSAKATIQYIQDGKVIETRHSE